MPPRRKETRKKTANSADQLMRHKSLEVLPISKLQPYARNARVHSKKQTQQVADSILRFGFTNPVLIDNENTILAGHCRVAAARLLGLDRVPCLRIENMSAAEKQAYVLADNKLPLNAGWDEEILAEELQALGDIDFDIAITGFSIPEIDGLIEGLKPEEPGDPEGDLLPIDGAACCRPGDLWQLGSQTLRFSRAYWVRECPRAVTLSFSISFDEQLYASRSRAFASVFLTRSAARPRRRVRPDRNLKEPRESGIVGSIRFTDPLACAPATDLPPDRGHEVARSFD